MTTDDLTRILSTPAPTIIYEPCDECGTTDVTGGITAEELDDTGRVEMITLCPDCYDAHYND